MEKLVEQIFSYSDVATEEPKVTVCGIASCFIMLLMYLYTSVALSFEKFWIKFDS